MKKFKPFPLVEFSILAFCLWLSRDLLNAWQYSPHDRLGWLALLIWISPLAARLLLKKQLAANAYFLGAAIVIGTFGELADFNFLGYAALSLALAAWMPTSPWLGGWLIAAVAWMPVLGWEMAHFPEGLIVFLRPALALAGVACCWPRRKIDAKT